MVKFIARYKEHEVGSRASLDQALEEWLVSRQYAINVLPPLQPEPPKKPLTTRKKNGGR